RRTWCAWRVRPGPDPAPVEARPAAASGAGRVAGADSHPASVPTEPGLAAFPLTTVESRRGGGLAATRHFFFVDAGLAARSVLLAPRRWHGVCYGPAPVGGA